MNHLTFIPLVTAGGMLLAGMKFGVIHKITEEESCNDEQLVDLCIDTATRLQKWNAGAGRLA